jgi:O-succinylbenzoate synthase
MRKTELLEDQALSTRLKVEAITLREIRMPLVHFFETSFGRTYSRRILLVTVHCDGVDGWAESVAGEDPYYSSEWTESAWPTIRQHLAPAVLGRSLNSARESVPLMAKVRGHRMAKAAVENALWDAEAKQRKQPLWKLLGGARQEIQCGVSIGIQDSVEQLLDKVQLELAAGYRRIKLKVKPGWDLKIIDRVRSRWPNTSLSCDANSAYTLDDIDYLRKFDQFNLLMIEQPLWNDDIYYHARLQRELRTSICLDESIRHARDCAAAIETGACRIVNIKVGRVGGFSEAKKIHDLCQSHNLPVWCGGMLESGIGRAHNVALSTLENFKLPGDVSASKRYWKEDIIEPDVEVTRQGTITVSDEPGTGYRIREDLIEKLTTRKETLRATS